MLDIIEKTRDHVPLTRDDIARLITGIVDNSWPDYQLSAWLMAATLNGLTDEETFQLTGAMAFSNGQPDPLGVVDKHSTGGVGDKTTLVLAPIVASLGIPVAKMSGRGLGHTGGTLDKLESIPGFRTALSPEEIQRQVKEVGVAVVAQTEELAPADRRLYALRDVTGTVNQVSLIASSVMSKKLATGTPNLVLDVKVGSGAFMADVEQARVLARLMVNIGRYYNRRVTALITSMDQPLGWAVGNAIEVNEARDCLLGKGPDDLREEVIHLSAEMVRLASDQSLDDALTAVKRVLDDGRAWETFQRWIARQGGLVEALNQPLTLAPIKREWRAHAAGTIVSIDTRKIGRASLELGAGRHRLDDSIDPQVGILCYAKIGTAYAPGDLVGIVYARTEDRAVSALRLLEASIQWGESATPPPLILDRLGPGPHG